MRIKTKIKESQKNRINLTKLETLGVGGTRADDNRKVEEADVNEKQLSGSREWRGRRPAGAAQQCTRVREHTHVNYIHTVDQRWDCI